MKRRLTQTGIVALVVFTAMGCAREVYDISWTGVVADKETKRPVSHAQIWATCSYQKNIDETAEIQKCTLSDEYGRFNFTFFKGFGFRVNTKAPGFLSGLDYKVVKKASMNDTIFISPHPFNASLVVRFKNKSNSFSPRDPFIRQSMVKNDGKVDRKSVGHWGYDFLNGTNTNILDSADVWLEINKNNQQLVLKVPPKGGIFAVHKPENSDFITRVTKAPEAGYARHHVITGSEAGFFVLCRNGTHVAKVIPQERICEITYKLEDQLVSEKGIRFDYLFQPDPQMRLFFPVSASADKTVLPGYLEPFFYNRSPESSPE